MTKLIQPSSKLKKSFINSQVQRYLLQENFKGFDAYLIKKHSTFSNYISWLQTNFDTYLDLLQSKQEPGHFPFVPQQDFWLAQNQTFLGRSTLRFHLTPQLRYLGGHIGLFTNPLHRQKGYGTKLLHLTIQEAFNRNIRPLLLTTSQSNSASQKIIVKNGGHLTNSHGNLLYFQIS